jgi:hypothetical protein
MRPIHATIPDRNSPSAPWVLILATSVLFDVQPLSQPLGLGSFFSAHNTGMQKSLPVAPWQGTMQSNEAWQRP